MYQALYRKYRPKNLSEVVGQDIIIKTLTNTLKNEKLSHAYLFTGPRGTGKTSVAKILAKVINCNNPINYNPCNNCVNCTQNNHIDIIEIDAASNNGVDEIRELKNKINLVPSLGKYKIYIIDEVHMLSIGAFNALLKTLEEPPAHAIFILATTEPHKIPTTILSRCQRLDFKKITNNSIIDKLNYVAKEEKIDISEEAISEIARLSDGGLRDAISMLDQVNSYADNKITLDDVYEINGIITKEKMNEFVLNMFDSNLVETLDMLDEYNASGKNLVKLFEEIMYHMKNILIYKTAPKYFINKNEDVSIYESIANNIDNKKLMDAIKEFSESLVEVKYNNNPKLKIELVLIKIMNKNVEQSTNINIKIEKDNVIKNVKTKTEKTVEDKITKKEESKKEKKIPVNSIIEEQKIESKVSKKDIEKNKIKEELKIIRINNTLSAFDKKLTMKLKKDVSKLSEKIYEVNNKEILSLVLDADLKAASDKNIIFVLEEQKLSDYFNDNIEEIEELLIKYLENKYKVISVEKQNWEIIKKEFNNKEKNYEYKDENNIIEQLKDVNHDIDQISNIFGEIVEYN